MLKKKVEDLLNTQIVKEDYSSQLYLSMASWAENQGFPGVAEWLYAQAEEEREHMLRLIRYVNEMDGKAAIPGIEEPPADFGDISSMFDQVLEHERYISNAIHEIVAVCVAENDYTTHSWIQWFVTEQMEEESSVKTLIDKLKLVGNSNLYMFDRDIMSIRSNEDGGEN
ncbi:MAG: ferritin [Bacteroidetes bacterium]|nr:MAG: ferritin [Bacteroidota bacterium]